MLDCYRCGDGVFGAFARKLIAVIEGNRDHSLPFLNADELIGLHLRERVFVAAGPDDLHVEAFRRTRFAQTEGERQFALREIT